MNTATHRCKQYYLPLISGLLLALLLFGAGCSATPEAAEEGAVSAEEADHHADDNHHADEAEDHDHRANDDHHADEADHHDDDAEHHADDAVEETAVQYDHHGNPIRDEPSYEQVLESGISVEFTVENFLGIGGRGAEFAGEIFEGEYALVKFNISDAETGAPLQAMQPAAWLDRVPDAGSGQEILSCEDQVKGYVSGALGARPLVNFNSYFILAMNEAGTISVIDPMIDVAGMTNLYTMIDLPAPAEDWAMSGDQNRLFVTSPETGQVSAVDLERFQTIENIDTGGRPVRIIFSPDGRYLWVGNDSVEAADSGITVIDSESLAVIAQIPTGAGHHELAFAPDGRTAFVTNSQAGTLSVVDVESLAVVKEINVGPEPAAVDVSAAGQAIYVASEGDGTITIVDSGRLAAAALIETKPGLADLRLTPDGEWGFVTNTSQSEIYIFDTTSNTVRYVLPVQGAPDQISFGRDAAYIRTRGLPALISIPTAELGESETVAVLTLPMGKNAPGVFPALPEAKAVYPTPDEGAMLVANPADDQIYFYTEGSQAALGGFQGHGLNPRAVQVVDRSLREEAAGIYTGRVRVPASGDLRVAFLLNDPKIVHCFTFTAKPNPQVTERESAVRPELELVTDLKQISAGEPFKFQLTLTDAASDEPLADVPGLQVLIMQVGSTSNLRFEAMPQGGGLYETEMSLNPGLYQALFSIPAAQTGYQDLPVFSFKVAAEEAAR